MLAYICIGLFECFYLAWRDPNKGLKKKNISLNIQLRKRGNSGVLFGFLKKVNTVMFGVFTLVHKAIQHPNIAKYQNSGFGTLLDRL